MRSIFELAISIIAYGIIGILAQSAQSALVPANFTANPSIGGGGTQFKDSAHFRVYGVSDTQADGAIKELEGAYSCFVETLGWRSSGLSYNPSADTGPYYKMNLYGVSSLPNAIGAMFSDTRSGLSYIKVVKGSIADPTVTVHEYGHALTYHERNWVDQKRTGAWWESVAQFVADTYLTSPLCEKARTKAGRPEGRTLIELRKVIGSSYQVILDGSPTGNHYQAWPLLSYLTYNPDNYSGLGATTVREMFRKYKRGSNETPLHVLERVASPTSVQKIVGRYWARMAYVDIGHKKAQQLFTSSRSVLKYANLDPGANGTYRVKANRQPKYMGSNIIPLTGSGSVTVKVTAEAPFTATLAVRSSSGIVRYMDLEKGAGQTNIASGEEASLVVVNTPDKLYMYDAFSISGDVDRGLNYQIQLTGATA